MQNVAVFPGYKLANDYAAQLGALYNAMPKAVIAAVLVSFTMMQGDSAESETPETIQRRVLDEWATLHRNAIVPQAPPAKVSR